MISTHQSAVMEYMGGGEVKWRTNDEKPTLTVDQSRRIVRDVILGLEYREISPVYTPM